MCRNIRRLYNCDPPVEAEEVCASALQYVRKVSGYRRPSRVNEAAFERAVDEVTAATERLLATLETKAPPRSQEWPARRARRPL